MSLIDCFAMLNAPTVERPNLFNAALVPAYPFVKIGITHERYPALLIAPISDSSSFAQRNIRLKNLELSHNIECRVSSNGTSSIEVFTVIIFKSSQSLLQRYFLSIGETLLSSLSAKPSQNEVGQSFKGFVEIFKALSEPPTNTIHGLWSELFLIDNSRSPSVLLSYWHNLPHERFDFNADVEKLEVKSSSTMERIHVFSSEQLNPPLNTEVLIASMFVRQTASGRSINDLSESIGRRIIENSLLEKMFGIIANTLGDTLEQSIKLRFDYSLARNSLRFYKCEDIQKIEAMSIPAKVSDVKYKSDLTELYAVPLPYAISTGSLFAHIT